MLKSKQVTKNIKLLFRVFFTPHCWIRNHAVSKRTDAILKELIELDQEPIKKSQFVFDFKRKDGSLIRIWISNYPYAFGSLYPFGALPTRRTAFEFYDRFI